MEGTAVFTLVMLGLSFLPTLIVPLVLFFVFRSALRGRGLTASVSTPSWSGMKVGCSLFFLLCISGFSGLMVATAGGAIHPPVITVAAPYVCEGTVAVRSQNYSYKPGQSGVSREVLCAGADGEVRDITLKTIGAATIYYTLIFMAVGLGLAVLAALARLLKPRLGGGPSTGSGHDPRPGPGSGPGSGPAPGPVGPEVVARFLNDRILINADILRRNARPADDTDGDSVRRRLENLQALRDDDLITEEEYQTKRAEVLSSL